MKTINKSILILGLLTFVLQSCTHDVYVDPQAAEKAVYENADAVNGAKLFSNFLHLDAGWPIDVATALPDVKFAADPTINMTYINTNKNFYLCNSCHPTDGMGRSEIGNNKKVAANQPDVAANRLRDVKSWDNIKLFDAIKNVGGRQTDPTKTLSGLNPLLGENAHPDFSKILTDDKIWDLVKWLKEGAIYNENNDLYTVTTTGTYTVSQNGTTQLPYALFTNLGSDGDEAAGVAYYAAKCTVCHGVDGHGTTNAQGPVLAFGTNGTGGANATYPVPPIVTTVPGSKKYGIGPFMRIRTPDGMLKVIAGQFGTNPWMAATPVTRDEMKNLLKAFSNKTRFPDFDAKLVNP